MVSAVRLPSCCPPKTSTILPGGAWRDLPVIVLLSSVNAANRWGYTMGTCSERFLEKQSKAMSHFLPRYTGAAQPAHSRSLSAQRPSWWRDRHLSQVEHKPLQPLSWCIMRTQWLVLCQSFCHFCRTAWTAGAFHLHLKCMWPLSHYFMIRWTNVWLGRTSFERSDAVKPQSPFYDACLVHGVSAEDTLQNTVWAASLCPAVSTFIKDSTLGFSMWKACGRPACTVH